MPSADYPVISTGLNEFLKSPYARFKGKRCALVTNQSGVSSDLQQNRKLLRDRGLIVDMILVPEHGLFSFVDWPDSPSSDNDLGFGERIIHIQSMSPKNIRKNVEGHDAVIFDIQTVGMRCFTYISELSAIIDALDGSSIELVVLDRPNPLIPYGVDGIMQDPKFSSRETSYFPAPMNHALTDGEAAVYYRDLKKRNVNITVIPMKGYDRELFFSQTGLPWVPPSPNLPSYESVITYSSAVYFEGTNLSVGRGTPNPFRYIGAPWIDASRLCDALTKLNIRGFAFRPVYFKPSASIYSGRCCGGVQIFLTGDKFSACENAYRIMNCLKTTYPQFRLLKNSASVYGIDILAGSDLFRSGIEKNMPYATISEQSEKDRRLYEKRIKKYFIY
jgi:uncharacterized protein YbbC (DUF1343 family)